MGTSSAGYSLSRLGGKGISSDFDLAVFCLGKYKQRETKKRRTPKPSNLALILCQNARKKRKGLSREKKLGLLPSRR